LHLEMRNLTNRVTTSLVQAVTVDTPSESRVC